MPPHIRIICVGKVKEPYLRQGISEYQKRISRFARLEIVELKDEGMDKEALKIAPFLEGEAFILDESGHEADSKTFAKMVKNRNLTFILGGAEGVSSSLKKEAPLISLSRMTFVHEMARLFLLEQLYRSFMINSNRKYHR